jgi:AcrR family transcriptional regulator
MPRGFSENQMQTFRDKLIAATFEALKNTGVRKTTVQDLAKAAGLSVGAFYKFYPSKEALFFEAYEIAEERLKVQFFSVLQTYSEVSSHTFRFIPKQILHSEAMEDLLRLMQKEELDYMLRSIDPEIINLHIQKDYEFLQNVIDALRAKGLIIKIEVSALLDYLQALFVLCYEKHQYPEHAGQIIDSFIDTIVAQAVA